MNGLVQLSQVLSKPILDGLVNPLIVTTEGDLGKLPRFSLPLVCR